MADLEPKGTKADWSERSHNIGSGPMQRTLPMGSGTPGTVEDFRSPLVPRQL